MKRPGSGAAGRPGLPERWSSGLRAAGFVRDRSAALRLGSGPALEAGPQDCFWQRLTSGDLPASGPWPDAILDERLQPEGPFKLARGSAPGWVRFVADLPVGLVEAGIAEPSGLGLEGDPVAEAGSASSASIWASDLARGLARAAGRTRGPSAAAGAIPPPSAIAAWLGARGWEAAVEGEEVGIAFQGRHRYGKVRIGSEGGCARLAMSLAESRGWSAVSLEALLEVACRANEGLRLVRISWSEERGRRTVSARVHLGRLPVLSGWLELGLDALRAASGLLSAEVGALESSTIADLVLSGARACGRSPARPSGSAGAR